MNIEMPDSDERERSIQYILDSALPERRTITGEIKRLYRTVGIKNAFSGVGDAAVAAFLISFFIIFTILFLVDQIFYDYKVYAFNLVLFISPILYFLMMSIISWKEQMTGTWEVLAVCRYNIKYVTAIRVMTVSALGMIFIPAAIFPLAGAANYPNLIAVAFSNMFLYSGFILFVLFFSEHPLGLVAAQVVWLTGWGGVMTVFGISETEAFLSNLPVLSGCVLAFVLFLLYLLELRVFIMRATRRMAAYD